jgi:hypothetical protein
MAGWQANQRTPCHSEGVHRTTEESHQSKQTVIAIQTFTVFSSIFPIAFPTTSEDSLIPKK